MISIFLIYLSLHFISSDVPTIPLSQATKNVAIQTEYDERTDPILLLEELQREMTRFREIFDRLANRIDHSVPPSSLANNIVLNGSLFSALISLITYFIVHNKF
ncbi:unnamed protein product [Schistosoma turkestanicum]|nr:unnamed protein product [Schistosoma turkestanicum]